MDPEDEDLESFIANRRCRLKVTNREREVETPRKLTDDTTERPWRTPLQSNNKWIATRSFSQAGVECSVASVDAEGGMSGHRRRSPSMIDEFEPLIDFSTPGDHPDHDWRMKTSALEAAESCESPLFVPQTESTEAEACTRPLHLTSRLIPVEYDSDSNDSEPAVADGNLHISRTPLSKRYSHATRDITMKDAFAKPDYVNKIRRNPYTSGIFAYEKSTENNNHSRGAKSQSLEGLNTSVHNLATGTGPDTRTGRAQATHDEPGKNTPFNEPKLSSTGLSATGVTKRQVTEGNRCAHNHELERKSKPLTPIATSLVDSPGAERREILDYLKSQYRIYNTALMELGPNFKRNEEYLQELEAQIQPEYDAFARELSENSTKDVGILQAALENWDMDIGVRALMQKWLMYHKLLENAS